jgi:hypothetical protein
LYVVRFAGVVAAAKGESDLVSTGEDVGAQRGPRFPAANGMERDYAGFVLCALGAARLYCKSSAIAIPPG